MTNYGIFQSRAVYNLIDGLKPQRVAFLLAAIVPSGLAITAYLAGKLRRSVMPFMLMAGFSVGIYLAVSSTKWWFPHYFQLWLPALCVSLGWSHVLLGDAMGRKTALKRFLPTIIIVGLVVPIFVNQLLMYRLSPEEWAIRKYSPYIMCYVKGSHEINSILKPGENFYHFGDDTGLYYLTRRRLPISAILYGHLFLGPGAESLSKRVVGELEHSKPDMLVVFKDNTDISRAVPRWRENPVVEWCMKNYRAFPDNEGRAYYELSARKGSDLERRIFGEQTK